MTDQPVAPADATTPKRAVQSRTIDVQRRILDAAVEVMLEHGYAGASTVQIQERAGVSRGRLLHHFPSRDALLVAAAQHLARARVGELPNDHEWPSDARERIDAVIDRMALTFTQGYFWAATELWVAARTHDEIRDALLPGEREIARAIRIAMDGFFGPEITARSGYDDLREVIFTSLRGMALTTSFDPREEPSRRHVERLKRIAHAVLL
ncbi:TetR/AcrR family transcriptional regulator [Nocardioides sp. Root190]|uniref:TetR/AcrR family transcriptional regulator n=1 Tax=Nocardioides sp. Root190 TaxID=1736488 RepID=UPI000A49F3EA|nr:TetR/AcrR family transcriptional regulator [Nocardioides sp. Root190]